MKIIDYILKYWVMIVATVALISSAAIAGQKIKTLEEAVKKQVIQLEQVQQL